MLDDNTQQNLLSLARQDKRLASWLDHWIEWRTKKARPEQICVLDENPKLNGQVWCAGRGFGKTRIGAEETTAFAMMRPKSYQRIIAPTFSAGRDVCVEGDSGILNSVPSDCIEKWNRSMGEVQFYNGSSIKIFSAEEPDRLRGANSQRDWCLSGETLVTMGDGSQRQIKDILVGEYVLTRVGQRKVLKSVMTCEKAEVFELNTFSGASLIGTMSHTVFTGSQWKPLGEFTKGDNICLQSNTTEESGKDDQTGIICAAQERMVAEVQSSYIVGFTKTILAPLKMVMSSIIKMKILGIIIQKILSKCQNLHIIRCTVRECLEAIKKTSSSILTLAGKSKSFVALNAFGVKINSFLARWKRKAISAVCSAWNAGVGMCSFLKIGSAKNVEKNSLPRSEFTFSVVKNAQLKILIGRIKRLFCEIFPALIVKQYSNQSDVMQDFAANYAPKLFISTVRDVIPLKDARKVYNLEIEGQPEFFANGILVHNCEELSSWGGGAGVNAAKVQRETWSMAMLGLRLPPRATFIVTTTPKPSALMKELLNRKDIHVSRGSTYDNLPNLSENFRNEILRYEGTMLGRQEIYAELVDMSEQGIFKKDWFRLWPADKPLPHFEYVVLSYDTGFKDTSKSAFSACTTWGVFRDQREGSSESHVLLIDCWREKIPYPDLRERALKNWRTWYGAADPELERHYVMSGRQIKGRQPDIMVVEDKGSGQSLIQDMRNEGINCWAYNPQKAGKEERAHIVSPLVKQGKVWIPESSRNRGHCMTWCEEWLEELTMVPNCEYWDYCFIAGTKISTKRGDIPIENITVDDLVLTPDGWKPVVAAGITSQSADVIDRIGLIGTPNHPVFTLDKSYQSLKDIDTSTQVVRNNLCGFVKIALLKSLSSTEKFTTAWEESVSIIWSNGKVQKENSNIKTGIRGCMLQFMSFIQEKKFLKAMKLITRIGIHLTIALKIWSAYHLVCIAKCLSDGSTRKHSSNNWHAFALSHWLGTNLKKAALGIESILKKVFSSAWLKPHANACIAAKTLWQRLNRAPNTALTYAKLWLRIGKIKSLLLKDHAPIAEKVLHQKNTRLDIAASPVAIEDGKQVVYNLQVADAKCYFANGILVHNCDTTTQVLQLLRDNMFLEMPRREEQLENDNEEVYALPHQGNPYAG